MLTLDERIKFITAVDEFKTGLLVTDPAVPIMIYRTDLPSEDGDLRGFRITAPNKLNQFLEIKAQFSPDNKVCTYNLSENFPATTLTAAELFRELEEAWSKRNQYRSEDVRFEDGRFKFSFFSRIGKSIYENIHTIPRFLCNSACLIMFGNEARIAVNALNTDWNMDNLIRGLAYTGACCIAYLISDIGFRFAENRYNRKD